MGGKAMQININSRKISNFFIHLVLLTGIFTALLPFIWMILTSFKSNIEAVAVPMTVFPKVWDIGGYQRVWERDILTPYKNTIIITIAIVAMQLITGSMAAYSFARLKFPFKKVLFTIILCMLMVPQHMLLVPKYKIVSNLGFADNLIGVVIPNSVSITVTFFLRQSFLTFPKELEDAAKISGCSLVRIFTSILLPLTKAPLIAMGIMVMMFAWNDLLWPTVILTSEKRRLLSMFIGLCRGQYITDYGYLMAASVCAVLPMIIIYAFFQKYFIASITMTGIKG
jgi:multiple sugar transport system permease protein